MTALTDQAVFDALASVASDDAGEGEIARRAAVARHIAYLEALLANPRTNDGRKAWARAELMRKLREGCAE